jgi:NitT/TauT family transport system permease protein
VSTWIKPALSTSSLRLISLPLLFVVWEIAADLASSRLFPSASTVILAMWREAAHGALLENLAITTARVAAAFLISMILGVALGLAMGTWGRVDAILDSWLTVLLNIPAMVLIVLVYIWFGLTETAIVVSVSLNKLPATAVIIREGARTVDRSLMDMAASFRMRRWSTLRHVFLPQIYPYLIASARSGLALIWKIVLVAEYLGRSSGVGFEIQIYFQLFDVTHILAYSLAFILVIQTIEWCVLQPLERRATRGRR